jgi:MFS family permease
MYQSETAPKWIRGTIVGAYQLAITIGLFLASIVNNSTKDRDDSGSYRIPVAVQFLWSVILVVGYVHCHGQSVTPNKGPVFSSFRRPRVTSSRQIAMRKLPNPWLSYAVCHRTTLPSSKNSMRCRPTIFTR